MENFSHPKCLQILKTARELFWKHGFKRVSIEEICQQAQVSKMTYYKFFSNKQELAKLVYKREMDQSMAAFREIMRDPSSPAEKMRSLLTLKYNGTHEISREFLLDFYAHPDPSLKDYFEQTTSVQLKEIMNEFKEAQRKGIFRQDFKPEIILYITQKMADLIMDENLLKQYESPHDLIMELTNFFVYGISSRENLP